MLELLLITFVLVIIAVAGLGIKMLFDKNAEFKGGSCQASGSESLQDKGISCGCGNGEECESSYN